MVRVAGLNDDGTTILVVGNDVDALVLLVHGARTLQEISGPMALVKLAVLGIKELIVDLERSDLFRLGFHNRDRCIVWCGQPPPSPGLWAQ